MQGMATSNFNLHAVFPQNISGIQGAGGYYQHRKTPKF
jgi:hypothetical protein